MQNPEHMGVTSKPHSKVVTDSGIPEQAFMFTDCAAQPLDSVTSYNSTSQTTCCSKYCYSCQSTIAEGVGENT
jgi:hypothetical protein